jgi:hypothetical protein
MAQQNETDGEISTFTNCHLVTAVLAMTDSGWMADVKFLAEEGIISSQALRCQPCGLWLSW